MVHRFGTPDVLVPEEADLPVAGPGQVVIDVALACITFVETMIRAGRPPNPAMTPELPYVPGNGVGGVVVETGEGVDRALSGARVISSTGGTGGYAERVAVRGEDVVAVPDGMALDDAVALLADGRTAMSLMRAAAIAPGETVLVEAAAGGVGSLLVQLALGAGARVVAAAGGARKVGLARELGADVAVDYARDGWTEGLEPVDVVFDGVGGAIGRAAFELMRRGGRFCVFGMAGGAFTQVGPDEAAARGVTLVRGTGSTPADLVALTRDALAAATAGRMRPVIGQTFPLERAADAHHAIEARATVGKTLLTVSDPASRVAGA